MKKRILALCMGLLLSLTGCGGQKNTDASTAFTVNGEEISLREWNFYVRMNQMQWEKAYLEKYGDEMWGEQAGKTGKTLEEALREETFESVVRTHILGQKARELGLELTLETAEELDQKAREFMEAYHQALLEYAQADEAFVRECLEEKELGLLAIDAMTQDYQPQWTQEDAKRKGILYVLICTTGLRDENGVLEPFSQEEVARRTEVAQQLCLDARASGDLKEEALKLGLAPIEASVGRDNTGDGQEPRMLDAARQLEVGEVSDPIETEEGWFLVQLISDYDEHGTQSWMRDQLLRERDARGEELYQQLRREAQIWENSEAMDQIIVKKPLKDLL